MREAGEYGPDFVLSCHDNGMTRLTRVAARHDYVVVFFFLVAGGPGCTREVSGFRDLYEEFKKRKTAIIGISPDVVPALADFAKQLNVPFDLCSDADHAAGEAWGTYTDGRQARSTFLVNDKGTILKVWPRANFANNPQEVLDYLDQQIAVDHGTAPPAAAQAAPVSQEAAAAPAPAQAPVQSPAPAPASPGPAGTAAPAAVQVAVPVGGALNAGEVVCAFARTSLQLLLQHLESGGQLPPDLAELAGRVALLRYR